VESARLVVTAGLAEIAAGSIAMGLGGYLAARSDTEPYETELAREQREVVEKREAEALSQWGPLCLSYAQTCPLSRRTEVRRSLTAQPGFSLHLPDLLPQTAQTSRKFCPVFESRT
jgi:hypothetical protein